MIHLPCTSVTNGVYGRPEALPIPLSGSHGAGSHDVIGCSREGSAWAPEKNKCYSLGVFYCGM